MKWDVVDVKPIAPLALEVRFADGTSGNVRFEASHLTGVFEPLRNEEFFRRFIWIPARWHGRETSIWHRTRCTRRSRQRASGYYVSCCAASPMFASADTVQVARGKKPSLDGSFLNDVEALK